jgi:hypothetical protein
MEVAKGPGGAYWMVMNNEGDVVSTHPTKEMAQKAAASKPTTYQNKMAIAETIT